MSVGPSLPLLLTGSRLEVASVLLAGPPRQTLILSLFQCGEGDWTPMLAPSLLTAQHHYCLMFLNDFLKSLLVIILGLLIMAPVAPPTLPGGKRGSSPALHSFLESDSSSS